MTAFASVDELKSFMGIQSFLDDARAEALLADASALIRQHLDQTVDAVSDDEIRMNPSFTRRLFLAERPVTAISSVLVDNHELPAEVFTFEIYGVLRRVDGDIWEAEPQGIHITYDHGYTTIPGFIVAICKAVAGRAITAAPPQTDQGQSRAETAGFAPGIFLMPSEKTELDALKPPIFG